jgi:hypothetical protein
VRRSVGRQFPEEIDQLATHGRLAVSFGKRYMSAISHGYADYRTRAAPRVRGSFICGSEPWLVDEPLRRGELLRYGATVPVRAPTSVSDPSAPSPARRKGGPARPGGESLRAKSASGTRPARISSPSCARTPPPADGPRESSSMPGSLAPKSPNRHSMICYALPAVGRWTRWWAGGWTDSDETCDT